LTEVEIQGKEVSIMWFESPLKQEDDLKSWNIFLKKQLSQKQKWIQFSRKYNFSSKWR
jgi:hypothetical protein